MNAFSRRAFFQRAGLFGLSLTRPTVPLFAGLTDFVDMAQEPSRETVGDWVGGHDTRRRCKVVRPGGRVSFRVKTDPRAPTTLEFEEIYGRETGVRGYQIRVDDAPVFFRTWPGGGAGPVHFFVQIPPTGKASVIVKLVNAAETAFAVSRVWVWSDFSQFFARADLDVPYVLAPTVALRWNDFDADLARLHQIPISLGSHPHVRPGWTTWIPYAALSIPETRARIDYVLKLAQESRLPVQIAFDTWWASTPGGPDGKGGFWTDVEYQQVVYNATQEKYQLSVPNRWSSTPWLTVAHPRLNAYKARRLTEATAWLARQARGRREWILAVNLDNEPVYWASGGAGLGSDLLLADFNPTAAAAAKRSGVNLDPANGLNEVERRWLGQNLLAYNETIASAARLGLGRDASLVDGTKVTPARDGLRQNIYTQAMVGDPAIQYPMLDSAWPFWETAAPRSARVGGEWNGDAPFVREAALHQIALGRAAAVNAESGNRVEHHEGVLPGYALGQRFFTPYNFPLDKLDAATADLRDVSQSFPSHHYLRVLREDEFRDDRWKNHVARHGGLQTGIIGNTAAIAVFPASPDAPGFLTYKLDGNFADGLFLELDGRAFVFQKRDPQVHIRVLAGPTLDTLTERARFFDNGAISPADRVTLTPNVPGRRTVFVRLELHAPGLSPSVLSWCAVHRVRFVVGWPARLTRGLPPQDESLLTVRRQNLLVSARADAELALAEASPAPARNAFARGEYAAAYRLAVQAQCVRLPAAFFVRRSGWLRPFTVYVETSRPVACTVEKWSAAEIRLALDADAPTPVRLRVGSLPVGATFSVSHRGGVWTLRRAPAGHAVGPTGELVWEATAPAPPALPASRVMVGFFRAVRPNGLLVMPYVDRQSSFVKTDARTKLTRARFGEPAFPASSAEFRRGDEIIALLNPDGAAREVLSTYQEREGTVAEWGSLTPFAMPFARLEGESRRHVVDLAAPLHTAKLNGAALKSVPPGSVDIAPGDRVRLRADSRTGRVWELWKTG